MKKKFNPKHYTGKDRIERSLSGNPGISKIWVWNQEKMEYQPPISDNTYVAEKTVVSHFKKVRMKETFATLDEARAWKQQLVESTDLPARSTPKFASVIELYKRDEMPRLRQSTQDSYNRMLSKYFVPLMGLQMSEINPNTIDGWIGYLKELPRRKTRKCFSHEFNLLSGIIKFYSQRDDYYQSPLRERHRKIVFVENSGKTRSQDLTESEFLKFRKELEKGPNADLFITMATVQFYQALRISEVAALKWEDIKWDQNPSKTRLRVSRSYHFPRKGNAQPVVQDSFKNGKQNGGIKEAPLFREAYEAINGFKSKIRDPKGFIFHLADAPLTYRQIQHAYDLAFERACLSYRGTHVMRHGGARKLYNRSNGDLAIVQQLLGKSDYKSALVYAKRSSDALNEFAEESWENPGESK